MKMAHFGKDGRHPDTSINNMMREGEDYARRHAAPYDNIRHFSRSRPSIPRFNLDETSDTTDVATSSEVSYSSGSPAESNLKVNLSLSSLKRKLNEKDSTIHYINALSEELKFRISNNEPQIKKLRIETDKEIGILKQQLEGEKMKTQTLLDKLKQFEYRAGEVKTSYKEERDKLETELKNLNAKFQSTLKKLSSLDNELQEERSNKQSQSRVYDAKIMQLKSELFTKEDQLEHQKEQFEITKKKMQETFEVEKQRLNNLHETEIYQFQQKLKNHEEAEEFVESMKSNIKDLIKKEKEFEMLKKENKILRENQSNVLLFQEKLQCMQDLLNSSQRNSEEVNRLKIENQSLKISLNKWESLAKSLGEASSPSTISSRVALLQKREVALQEEMGHLKCELNASKLTEKRLEEESRSLKNELDQVKKSVENINSYARKLKHRQLLLTKECESYKRLISSYENEVTMDMEFVKNDRIHTLESLVEDYKILLEEANKANQMRAESKDCKERDPASLAEVKKLKGEVDQLRSQVTLLEAELAKNKEVLQRQSDPPAPEFRVIHFKANPVALAEIKRSKEVEMLRKENEKLKIKLQVLSEKHNASNLTMESSTISEAVATEQIKTLQEQLQLAEQKSKRMMDAFKKTSTEFREITYLLTGYRIDIIASKKYKLSHLFSESPNEHLIFESTDDGKLQLLETDYSKVLSPLIGDLLVKRNSIPAFLSTLTLDLYKNQTITL